MRFVKFQQVLGCVVVAATLAVVGFAGAAERTPKPVVCASFERTGGYVICNDSKRPQVLVRVLFVESPDAEGQSRRFAIGWRQ